MKAILKKLSIYLSILRGRYSVLKKSFSQCGEDIIIGMIAGNIGLKKWSWLDIGAHHPEYLSNTAMYYSKGMRGINIEADPVLFKRFRRKRRRDLNLNIAIADRSGRMNFYIMDASTLNTLSEEEAHRYSTLGHKIEKVIEIETMTVDEVVCKYCNGVFPEILFCDAEGYDLPILKTINWEKSLPLIICIENIPYNRKLKNYFKSMQTSELSLYLESKGYSMIAFTGINSIFVRDSVMEKG
jgi:FkbM family methyltransferase